jgi:methylmalonyl-CoA mutase, N-terminal domain
MLRFHAQTAGSTLTAQQIDTNVARVTLQALAAVLGGCQSLHTNSRDEALALPTEVSALLALRTQQVVGYETGVTDTVDPLGGSFYVESLTDQLEEKAWEYIAKIDALGGAVVAIEKQLYQNEIAESAYRYQQEIERKEKIIVGVNEFTTAEREQPPLLSVSESVRGGQTAKLANLKKRREGPAVARSLSLLTKCAAGNDNLFPAILDCVERYATLGEIADALRSVWGEY